MTKGANMWGGRFTGKTDQSFADFNNSFAFDRRLFKADIQASVAHCNALTVAGVLSQAEASNIKTGLQAILKEANAQEGYLDGLQSEDRALVC